LDATDPFPVRRCLERIGRVLLGECTIGQPAVSAHSRRIACLAIELDADGILQTASSKAPAADGTANSRTLKPGIFLDHAWRLDGDLEDLQGLSPPPWQRCPAVVLRAFGG
jgi:hypothetical protein